MDCVVFTFENRVSLMRWGVSGVVSFLSQDEQLQYNRSCYISMEAMLFEGFSIPFKLS